ncbi:MAG: hypothetical protein JSR82_24050 [Verrucomicrobia bacterium]|nr:hypothetical protein [Verrucomicrobiota bacterium]
MLRSLLLALLLPTSLLADALADRAAIERVYHARRLGTKQTFEETMPPQVLAGLVARDALRERVLRQVYGVEVTAALVEAEVRRIDATTRAPEMLAELKAALGNDAQRFAAAVARPIVVERILRARFEQDSALHAPVRKTAEALRERLLAARAEGAVAAARAEKSPAPGEVQWRLTPRTEAAPAPSVALPQTPPVEAKAGSRSYSVEATVSPAQVLGPPPGAEPVERVLYFEDLEPELRRVLDVQLTGSGKVSAVIESAQGFQVFVAVARDAQQLQALVFSLPKQSFDEWLAAQDTPSRPK